MALHESISVILVKQLLGQSEMATGVAVVPGGLSSQLLIIRNPPHENLLIGCCYLLRWKAIDYSAA